jgi:hypothetical protein
MVTARLTDLERKALLPLQLKVQAALQELQAVFRGLLAGKGIDTDEWDVVLPLDPQQQEYQRRRRAAAPADAARGAAAQDGDDAA